MVRTTLKPSLEEFMNTSSFEIQRHWHDAETALIKKDWFTAGKHYKSIIAKDNEHVHSLIRLASVQLQLGDFNDARHYTLRASQVDNDDEAAMVMVARQLMLFSESEKLVHYLTHICFRKFKKPMLLAEMSVLLNAISENNHALSFVNRAIELDPTFAPAFYFRGNLHTFAGNKVQACIDLEHCLELNPRFAQAYWALSGLSTKEIPFVLANNLRKQLKQATVGGSDEIYFSHAMHNELHKQEDTAESWHALEYSCHAKRKKVAYSPTDTKALFDGLKAVDWAGMVPSTNAQAGQGTPIFIVGMHRSGTTLLEQMLAGHMDIADGGESSAFLSQLKRAANYPGDLKQAFVEKLQQTDLSQVACWFAEKSNWRFGKSRYFTEKLPSNFLLIGFILKAIPNAKIIHLVRDPVSTCFSNLRTLFHFECGYSYDQNELADYFSWYRDLMAFWHSQFPGQILDMPYYNLVSQPETAMREVCQSLGIEYQSKMIDVRDRKSNVTTASTVSVREGIQADRNEQWKRYAEQLDPLLARLKSYNLIA